MVRVPSQVAPKRNIVRVTKTPEMLTTSVLAVRLEIVGPLVMGAELETVGPVVVLAEVELVGTPVRDVWPP